MKEAKLSTVAQLRAFIEGTSEVRFEQAGDDAGRYTFIQDVLRACENNPGLLEFCV